MLELPETPPEPVQRKAELLGVPWAARFSPVSLFFAGNREVFKKNREAIEHERAITVRD